MVLVLVPRIAEPFVPLVPVLGQAIHVFYQVHTPWTIHVLRCLKSKRARARRCERGNKADSFQAEVLTCGLDDHLRVAKLESATVFSIKAMDIC